MSRGWILALALVLIGGTGLRVGRFLEERQGPLAHVPVGDEGTYDRWGQRLARGEAQDEVPYQAPLQAYHLAAWHRLFPDRAERARDGTRLVGLLLGVGTIVLTFLLGREVGSAAVGVVAAGWVAFHRPLIYYEPTLLRDGAATFMTVLAVLFLVRWQERLNPARALALGALLGIGALMRENLLLLGLLVALGLGVAAARADPGRRRSRAAAAGFLLVGLLLPLAPWIASNQRLEGSLSLFPTWNGGTVFYVYNRADNLSAGYQTPSFVGRGNPERQQEAFRGEAERRLGRALTPHQVSSYWLREGLREVAGAPALYARKVVQRSWGFLCSAEVVQARDMVLDGEESWVLRVPSPAFGCVAALALLGLISALRVRGSRTLALVALALAATVVGVGFVTRYRLPVVPLMAVLAALSARDIGRGAARLARLRAPGTLRAWAMDLSRRQSGVAWVLAGAGAALLGVALSGNVSQSHDAGHLDRAIAWFYLDRYAEVEAEVARMERPDPIGLEMLGEARLRGGRLVAACEAYRGALRLDPQRARGWAGLATALALRGERTEALTAIRRARALEDRPAFADLQRELERKR